jgi:hypothetical protein
MVRDKGDLMPLNVFAMGLKNNAEENLKALNKDAVKLSMVGWMILDIPRSSRRMSTSPQGQGHPVLVPGEPLGALAQGGLGPQQPQAEAPGLLGW